MWIASEPLGQVRGFILEALTEHVCPRTVNPDTESLEDQRAPRRSRIKRTQYVPFVGKALNVAHDSLLGDPLSFDEAVADCDKDEWMEAMK